MISNQNIAFVLYEYPLGVSSMVINSIKLFAKKGFTVDVYTNHKNLIRSPIEFSSSKINMYIYDDSSLNIILKVYRFIIRKTDNLLLPASNAIPNYINLLLFFPYIYMFSKWLKAFLNNIDYTFIIPVEYYSLVTLEFIKNKKRIIYFNMELMDWASKSELVQNKLIWKTLEYRKIKQISHVVVPSTTRAKAFSKINNFNFTNIMILPVTSMGEPIRRKSRFFRDYFGISDENIIVIYSGNFRPWAKCLEIINSVNKWPSNFVLIMHTWNTTIMKTQYVLEMIRKSNGLPVYFSNEYIDYNDLAQALSSADIGLAFYKNIDKNFREILFSSNKIGEYLKAGLAIICSDFSELKKYVETKKIGFSIPVDNLPEALAQISIQQLETFKNNSLSCYINDYRFEVYFEIFFNNIFKNH